VRVEILTEADTVVIRTTQEFRHGKEKHEFRRILDHAWLKKSDIAYDSSAKEFVVKLKRHGAVMRAVGSLVWLNWINPKSECVLTIKGVEECKIRDEYPGNPERETVVIGGLILEDDTVYFGSFCDHENPFDVTLRVSSINITLEDTEPK